MSFFKAFVYPLKFILFQFHSCWPLQGLWYALEIIDWKAVGIKRLHGYLPEQKVLTSFHQAVKQKEVLGSLFTRFTWSWVSSAILGRCSGILLIYSSCRKQQHFWRRWAYLHYAILLKLLVRVSDVVGIPSLCWLRPKQNSDFLWRLTARILFSLASAIASVNMSNNEPVKTFSLKEWERKCTRVFSCIFTTEAHVCCSKLEKKKKKKKQGSPCNNCSSFLPEKRKFE